MDLLKNRNQRDKNNQELIKDIYGYRFNNIEFSFLGTGAAKILKLKNSNLTKPKKLYYRFYSLKNFFRKFYISCKNNFFMQTCKFFLLF